MEVSLDDLARILAIVDDSHYAELTLETGDLRLEVRKQPAAGESAMPGGLPTGSRTSIEGHSRPPAEPEALHSPAPVPPRPAEELVPAGLAAVRAPMLGTFYRAPSPGLPPFAVEGQLLEPRDTIGLIEVMKLFSTIPAGVSGRVVRFVAENGSLVELDQPLVLIEPMEGSP